MVRAKKNAENSSLSRPVKDKSQVKAESSESDKIETIQGEARDEAVPPYEQDSVVDLAREFQGEANDSSAKVSKAVKRSENATRIQTPSASEDRKQKTTRSVQAATTTPVSDYKSRIQTIRKNRTSISPSAASTPNESPGGKLHERVSHMMSHLFFSFELI